MNGLSNMIQEHLGKDLLVNGKCPENCYECCSLTVGTNIYNFRKLKKIIKPEHLEKYYSDNEELWWTCPFLIDGKCSIYHNASKPKICSAYVCSAEYFLNNNPKNLRGERWISLHINITEKMAGKEYSLSCMVVDQLA